MKYQTGSAKRDFIVADHGSIVLLTPVTPAAHRWIQENLPEDRQTWGLSVVVEPRYINDIVAGIQNDGLYV